MEIVIILLGLIAGITAITFNYYDDKPDIIQYITQKIYGENPSSPITVKIATATPTIIPQATYTANNLPFKPYIFNLKWGAKGKSNGEFDNPSGIAMSPSGEIYVCDAGNGRIQVFSKDGEYLKVVGRKGDKPGEFSWPNCITFDSSGNYYITDDGNNRIQKFDSSDKFITLWGTGGNKEGQFDTPVSVKIAPNGEIVIVDSGNNRIVSYTSDGQFLREWEFGEGSLQRPMDIEFDTEGNSYIINDGQWIQKHSLTGSIIKKWGGSGKSNGELERPASLILDKSGKIYVSDTHNNRIQVFSSSGEYLYQWGFWGTDDGQFKNPIRILIDSNDNSVYVCDTDNHRIQKFTQTA